MKSQSVQTNETKISNAKLQEVQIAKLNQIINDGITAIISGTVDVSGSTNVGVVGTDFDIRNLLFATDKVDVSGSVISATVDTSLLATAAKQDTGNTSLASILAQLLAGIIVTATNLDIRNLVFASDKVDVTGSTISATVDTSLLATSAKQDTGNASLSSIAAEDFATETTLALLNATDFATEAKQDSEITLLTSIESNTDSLSIAQGSDGASVPGILSEGLVNDTPSSFTVNTVQALSLTTEGRLRVSSVDSYLNNIWQTTFESDPWDSDLPTVANSSIPYAGEVRYV